MTDKEPKSQSGNQEKNTDRALWDEMTKDVAPLKNKNTVPPTEKSSPPKKHKPRPPSQAAPPASETPNQEQTPSTAGSNQVDHRTEQRLKRGQFEIEGRLDLHGMTQNQAYDALCRFIPSAHSVGKRCLLIVTGKGYQRHGDPSLLERTTGILKQKTPQWLSEPPLNQYVLNIQTARPKHGGEGALYVLLRRGR